MKKYIAIRNGQVYLLPANEVLPFHSAAEHEMVHFSIFKHDVNQPVYIGDRQTIDSLFDLEAIKGEALKAQQIIKDVNNALSARDLRKWAIEKMLPTYGVTGVNLRLLLTEVDQLINYIQNGNGKTDS